MKTIIPLFDGWRSVLVGTFHFIHIRIGKEALPTQQVHFFGSLVFETGLENVERFCRKLYNQILEEGFHELIGIEEPEVLVDMFCFFLFVLVVFNPNPQ